ncbi:hypothetical protein [Haloarcula onubensis]|uniref:Uncharacterized protein n=1 Tax=Haloarcula onubensis TaxID=2950539 RepID=A0ABU2FNL4_9EURY|nr:hypothetical protein [Halomicroarcula sp. S3CR25-11]MDS0282348.1 hypothetical protein [Halomicroarcula sp. S3CR25-11]
MSSASPFRSPTDALPGDSVDFRTLAVRPVQFVGFWTAVLAPLASLALLLSGLDERSRLLLLVGVFFANVLGLIVGRGYRADRASV